jgi:hypothetical protein
MVCVAAVALTQGAPSSDHTGHISLFRSWPQYDRDDRTRALYRGTWMRRP